MSQLRAVLRMHGNTIYFKFIFEERMKHFKMLQASYTGHYTEDRARRFKKTGEWVLLLKHSAHMEMYVRCTDMVDIVHILCLTILPDSAHV